MGRKPAFEEVVVTNEVDYETWAAHFLTDLPVHDPPVH